MKGWSIMKKLLSLILVLVMVFALGSLVACGGEDADTDKGDDKGSNGVNGTSSVASKDDGVGNVGSLYPKALQNAVLVEVPDVLYTGWGFAGGCVDGVEMEVDDVDLFLQQFGGTLQVIFPEGNTVMLAKSDDAASGTFKKTSDGNGLHLDFGNGVEYYAVFTELGDTTVMMMAQTSAPGTALYFTIISET